MSWSFSVVADRRPQLHDVLDFSYRSCREARFNLKDVHQAGHMTRQACTAAGFSAEETTEFGYSMHDVMANLRYEAADFRMQGIP